MAAPDRLEGERLVAHPLGRVVIAVVYERGYAAATVEEFLERSGTTREEFERSFGDKADVTLRVFEAFVGDFKRRVGGAYDAEAMWPDSLRAAAYETVRWFHEVPGAAWFGMVGMLEVSEMARVRREELVRWCAQMIEGGRAVAIDPDAVPRKAALLGVGAVTETVRRQYEKGVELDPPPSVPQLMYAAVRPYLGEAAARAELSIPPPSDVGPAERS